MKKKNEVFEMLTLITQLSISMLVPIMLCTLFGVWIGKKLDIDWPAVIGFIVGAAAGMESVYKIVKKYIKTKDDKGA